MITTLPSPKDVRELYTDLLGREVEMQVIDPWQPEPLDRPCAAEFVDDRSDLQAVAMLDLPLAVFTGAAIGLLPAGGAEDMIAERDPSEMVLGNLYEVLNVLTSTFNVDDNPHVRIGTLHNPGTTFPADIASTVTRPARRVDLLVKINGYGQGRLALVAA